MSGVIDIAFALDGRKFAFKMTYDENNISDKHLLLALNRNGCAEPEVARIMARVLKEGDVAIDGGANVGFFTVFMAQLVGPTGRVIACEPAQNNLWKLEANIRLNKLQNVEIERKPLWSKVEKVTFHMAQDGGLGSLAANPATAGKVVQDSITLSSIVSTAPHLPKLVKLDVEGAEVHALRGLEPWLSSDMIPYIVCEMNEVALPLFGSSQVELRTLMDNAGYRTFTPFVHGLIPAYIPPQTMLQTKNPNTGRQLNNVNLLFTTFDELAEIWPEAPAWPADNE